MQVFPGRHGDGHRYWRRYWRRCRILSSCNRPSKRFARSGLRAAVAIVACAAVHEKRQLRTDGWAEQERQDGEGPRPRHLSVTPMQVLLTNGGQDRCRSCRDITLRARLCDYRVYPSFEQNAEPSISELRAECGAEYIRASSRMRSRVYPSFEQNAQPSTYIRAKFAGYGCGY